MFKVFIDGEYGTTGLEIKNRLSQREDITLLSIPESLKKDEEQRLDFYSKADIVFLCLPDLESKSIARKANKDTRIIDASTAHRVDIDWTYGLPELSHNHKNAIKTSNRVANPGCHATGFILLVRPLIAAGLMDSQLSISAHSITGYSGGGKAMIAEYESNDEEAREALVSPGQYALTQNHKHLPEMIEYGGLRIAPIFTPIVGNYYRGILVNIPVHLSTLKEKVDIADIRQLYREVYMHSRIITVNEGGEDESDYKKGFIYSNRHENRDDLTIFVCGNEERVTLMAAYDNLGKGASGAAIQNMNIMLELPEYKGLHIRP